MNLIDQDTGLERPNEGPTQRHNGRAGKAMIASSGLEGSMLRGQLLISLNSGHVSVFDL